MSETAFEHDFLATPDVSTILPQPLRARPLGVRAALAMGGAASVILLATVAFVGPRREPDLSATAEHADLAPPPAAPAAAPAKIATKIDAPAPAIQAQSPFSAFDLNAPELAQEKKTIAARDGDDGAGRVDSVTVGQFEAGAAFLRDDVHQNATARETDADFFLDMTRHASRLGLNVAKIGAPSALQTRFGAFEAADIRLTQTQPPAEGGLASTRDCLAARLIEPGSSSIFAGLACGSSTLPISRATFGCLLDRLDYRADDSNKALGDVFRKAAAGAPSCGDAAEPETTASIPQRSRGHAAPAGHARRRHHR